MASEHSHIVLLDDDEEMVPELQEMLEFEGYFVSGMTDAGAVDDIDWSRVTLLIVDFFLPGSSGPEVVRLARAVNPHVEVIFVSGADIQHDIAESGIENARVLGKPVDPDALLETIAKVHTR